jgi:hypothetical protein
MSAVPPQLSAAETSPVPTVIGGRFEVVGVLGRGGMGTVFRVRDRHHDRLLALKRVSFGGQSSRRTLFEREYTTLAQLSHPLIIQVYDYALEDDAAYYTMELLDGDDISRLAPMPYVRVCHYLRQVATTLALLHARRLVHRDLSPRNVRVTRSDECKLLDFGALAAYGDSGAVIGTPPCVPPEALECEPLDQRLDLYGLGCLAYYALTGSHAYPVTRVEQLPSYWAQPLTPPSLVIAGLDTTGSALPPVPKELDELVLRLLCLDRSGRPSSAGAVIDRLNVILGQSSVDEIELAESCLASAPIVGRAMQLSAAAQCTAHLNEERGQVLVFQGAEGLGKTRLLSEIALATRVQGPRVVMIDARAADRPYAAARALCAGLFETATNAVLAVAEPYMSVLKRLVPELSRALPGHVPEPPSDDVLWHNHAQDALRKFILDLSRHTPLVLLVDNMHACDHASAAWLATLARETKQHALLLIVSLRTEAEPVALASCQALEALGETHELEKLTVHELEAWFENLFGRDTPNLPRLCQFVQKHGGGQPANTVELLYSLLHARDIRYEDGSWVLPLSPANSALPATATEALLSRVSSLGSAARSIANAFSLCRGMPSLELCHSLCDIDARSITLGLKELVDKRILVQQRDVYAFAHDGIRSELRALIPTEERIRLQRRIAETILKRESLQISERLETGLQLFETGDERGVRLLCRGGASLCLQPQDMVSCVPVLERAVELYKAHGRSRYELAMLLAPLTIGAYTIDRRLERYASELVECFGHLTGLAAARGMRSLVGKRLSTYLGLALGAVRYALTPRRARHARFSELVQMFVGSIVALCGKSAICLDGPRVRELAALIEPLTALGKEHPATYAHDYCRALSLVTEDRYTETYEFCLDLERRLETNSMLRYTSVTIRRMYQGGLHYVLGLFESFANDPKVLKRTAQLQTSDFDVDRLIAAQLRRVYHTFRGEAEPLREANEQVEAYALQTGSSWQVETWSAIITNYAASLWGDPVDSKRALEETERLTTDVPSLVRYAQSSRALYCLQRGQPRECIAIYDQMFAAEKPLERIGWTVSIGLLAEAHNQVGEHGRARELCEQLLGQVDPRDARYIGMYLPVSCAFAVAVASLGEHVQAAKYISELLELHAENQSPLVLGTLHEVAARLAWLRGDRKAYAHHLKEVERSFCALGHAALIGRFLRLTTLGGSEGAMSAKIAVMREVKAFDTTLGQISDRSLLARHVFAWLMQKCDGWDGYLFVPSPTGPLLLASGQVSAPPEAAVELARRSLSALTHEEATTHCGPVETNTHAERPGSKKHLRRAGAETFHVHLLSFVQDRQFFGEGALVLRGASSKPPRLRYDLLQVAAQHLRRLRPNTPPRSARPGSTPAKHGVTA